MKDLNLLVVEGNLEKENENFKNSGIPTHAESLRESISRLPEREGRILALRYGFYDGVPRTLEEIGEEFDLTRERIRQLEKLALCRLRHPSFGIREQDLV